MAQLAGWTLLRITRHKHLAAIAGFHTHRLAKRRLAGTEVTARSAKITAGCTTLVARTKITTWRRGFIASAGKTVIEAAFALIATAFGLTETATTASVLIAASTRITWASGVSICKAAAVGTKTTGTAATAKIPAAGIAAGMVVVAATACAAKAIGS